MDSTLVIKNSHTYCKNLQVIKNQVLRACSWRDRLVGKDHRSSPTTTHKEDNQITPHVSNSLHKVYHTCMLRDLQTSTQVFLNFTTTQLARLWYYYLHISKQLSSTKLIFSIQFNQKKVSHVLNTKYINIKKITMVLTTLKII